MARSASRLVRLLLAGVAAGCVVAGILASNASAVGRDASGAGPIEAGVEVFVVPSDWSPEGHVAVEELGTGRVGWAKLKSWDDAAAGEGQDTRGTSLERLALLIGVPREPLTGASSVRPTRNSW
jgi:hypothetical protein